MEYNTNPSDVQYQGANAQADFLSELVEKGAHLVLCKADKSPVDGWDKASAGAAIEHVETGGVAGVIPASLGLLCIDVDKGGRAGLDGLLAYCKYSDARNEVARTRRGWHIWLQADDLGITKRKFTYGAASGDIMYRGGYVCLHGAEAGCLCRLLDSDRDPVKGHWLDRLQPVEIPKNVPLTGLERKPAVLQKGGWYVGNRSNQLNCEIWYATLFNRPLEGIIAQARESGLSEEKIAQDMASTIKQAERHRERIAAKITQSDPLTVFKRKDLRSSCRALLIAMGSVAGDDAVCYATRSSLASAAGVSVATVKRALPRLRDAGLIEFVGRRAVGRRGEFVKYVNEYRVVV